MKNHIINKKGFTLVELLAVILIVGIIASIATYSITLISKSVKENHYKNVIARIEVAAEKYAFDTNKTSAFVIDLVNNGYLESDDDNNNIYNPIDNSKLNCYAIIMNSQGSYYIAKFQADKEYVLSNGNCNNNLLEDLNASLTLSAAQIINGRMTEVNKANWIKGDFSIFVTANNDITISCSNNAQSVQFPRCSINSDLGELSNDSIVVTSDGRARIDISASTMAFEKEGTYTFTYNRIANNNAAKELKESITLKLDNKAPEVSVSGLYISVTENGSGVYGYCINESENEVSDCTWFETSSKTMNASQIKSDFQCNTYYYVHVKDKVGNIGVAQIYNSCR